MLWVPLWGFTFFAEVPRWSTILGAALIVGAGIIALRQPGRPKKPANAVRTAEGLPDLINTGTLLETLRNISNQISSIKVEDVTKLCDLGLVVVFGTGQYRVTAEGTAVLKKAYQ